MAIEDSGPWTEFSVISEGLKCAKSLPSVNSEARRKTLGHGLTPTAGGEVLHATR